MHWSLRQTAIFPTSTKSIAPDGLTYSREEYGAHLQAAYLSLGITDYGEPALTPSPPRQT